MDHVDVGRYWNENAEAWTRLARAGYDVYRDYLNTPVFFAMLPEVRGLKGLDIGCGEGYNTRLLAEAGAAMTAVDISEVFVGYARKSERERPLGIDYQLASAMALPFEDEMFDFATAFMSFIHRRPRWCRISCMCGDEKPLLPGSRWQERFFNDLHKSKHPQHLLT